MAGVVLLYGIVVGLVLSMLFDSFMADLKRMVRREAAGMVAAQMVGQKEEKA